MQVITQNLLVNYNIQGQGPALLFLHGWGDNGQTFNQLIDILKESYTCITIDMPGFGASQSPAEAWDVSDYAKFVADFLDKIAIKPAAILGHSNGGTIAMYMAANNLVAAGKLALLASAGIRNEKSFKKRVYQVVAKAGKLLSKVLPEEAQQKLRQKLYSSAGSDLLVTPHLEETFKRVVKYDILDDAVKITAPTLLVYSDDDEATPVRYGEKLHEAIRGSKLEILSGGGHFVHQTRIDQVSKLIKEFL